MSNDHDGYDPQEYMIQFAPNPEEVDEDGPAVTPADFGEPDDHPSAVHGDFHSRPDLAAVLKAQVDLEGGA